MELNKYFDKFKEQKDAVTEFVNDQYNKYLLEYDSVAYQSVMRLNSNGFSMRREFETEINNKKLNKNTKLTQKNSFDEEILTIHTDKVYLKRTAYEKDGKIYPMFEGLFNIGDANNKQELRYVRCFAERWHDETTYDIMTVQVGEKDFYSTRVSYSANLPKVIDNKITEEFFKEIENVFNQEKEKCEEFKKEDEMVK